MIQRDALLSAEERAWQDLHEIFADLPDEDWLRPGCVGDWSPKDVLAHIACWAAEAVRQLECIRSGTPAKGPDVDTFNAESHEACKDLTIHETLAMASAAHHRLREELEIVAPVALSSRVVEMIEENAHKHYDEHIAHLRAFLSGEAS